MGFCRRRRSADAVRKAAAASKSLELVKQLACKVDQTAAPRNQDERQIVDRRSKMAVARAGTVADRMSLALYALCEVTLT